MTLPTTALLEGSKAEMCERQLARSVQLGSASTQSDRSLESTITTTEKGGNGAESGANFA